MEDILASIRRILSEDGGAEAPPTLPPAQAPPSDDVLDLTEQMMAPEPAAPAPKPMSSAEIDALFNEPSPGASPGASPGERAPPAGAKPMSGADIDALFSEQPAPASPPSAAPAAPSAAPAAVFGGDGFVGDGLVGAAAAAATAASLAALREASRGPANTSAAPITDMLLGNGAVTIEQLVREELRPVLKAWLDANLAALVERLVKAELERVARG